MSCGHSGATYAASFSVVLTEFSFVVVYGSRLASLPYGYLICWRIEMYCFGNFCHSICVGRLLDSGFWYRFVPKRANRKVSRSMTHVA